MPLKQEIDDQRNSVRLDFKVPVELHCADTDAIISGELENLSVHGMLVHVQDVISRVPAGREMHCRARIIFPGKASSLMIEDLESTIVRIESDRLGLEFSEPLEWFLLFNVYRGKQINL